MPAKEISKRPPRNSRLSKAKLSKVLELVAEGHSVKAACEQVGIDRRWIYKKRQTDPDFEEAFLEAERLSTEELESVVYKRAKEKSDLLAMFLLKARKPDVYRENVKHEHSGQVDLRLRAVAEEFDRRFAAREARVREIEDSGLRDG